MKKSTILKFLNFWPPYFGAGVQVKKISPDITTVEVQMKLRFWNQNYFGTHFGGSLYSMIDPFFALMLTENLGPDYTVWDKAATIKFKRPGRGTVRALFNLSAEQISEIRNAANEKNKIEPSFKVTVTDEEGMTVAEIEKVLHVTRKDKKKTRTRKS